jgi:hypothetical protein
MGYSVRCDWCGCNLSSGHFAEMPVKIKHRRRSALDSAWADEVRPTMHFCVPSDEGHNRMGIESQDGEDCCYERARALISGTSTDTPDMGMEWRLVPVGASILAASNWGREAEPDLADLLSHLPAQFRYALPRAGITTLAQLDAMTDEQLLAIKGMGPSVLARLRAAPRRKTAS